MQILFFCQSAGSISGAFGNKFSEVLVDSTHRYLTNVSRYNFHFFVGGSGGGGGGGLYLVPLQLMLLGFHGHHVDCPPGPIASNSFVTSINC